ncbi:MAG: hypothetical protein WBG67_05580 [Thermoanaerobaculia bacterium]
MSSDSDHQPESQQRRKLPVVQVLIGLQRIGLAGLWEVIKEAESSGLTDRETLLDRMMGALSELNFIPESSTEEYRRAVWREYLRRRGEDYWEFLSEIPVVVRGEANLGFVADLEAVFAEHDLKPVVSIEPAEPDAASPELVIDGESVIAGPTSRQGMRRAIQKQIGDW